MHRCVRTQSSPGHFSSVETVFMLRWLWSKHKRLSIFYGIKIGVKRDTLICCAGHSPAGAGLYGLLGRGRRRRRGMRVVALEEKGKSIIERRCRPFISAPSLRFSLSAMCHVDIAKLNSFYWVQFLAWLTSKNVRISLIFYWARSPRDPQIINTHTHKDTFTYINVHWGSKMYMRLLTTAYIVLFFCVL